MQQTMTSMRIPTLRFQRKTDPKWRIAPRMKHRPERMERNPRPEARKKNVKARK